MKPLSDTELEEFRAKYPDIYELEVGDHRLIVHRATPPDVAEWQDLVVQGAREVMLANENFIAACTLWPRPAKAEGQAQSDLDTVLDQFPGAIREIAGDIHELSGAWKVELEPIMSGRSDLERQASEMPGFNRSSWRLTKWEGPPMIVRRPSRNEIRRLKQDENEASFSFARNRLCIECAVSPDDHGMTTFLQTYPSAMITLSLELAKFAGEGVEIKRKKI